MNIAGHGDIWVIGDSFTTCSVEITPDSVVPLRHYSGGQGGPAILMIHGLGERAEIFAPASGGGLAPCLANAGYDVYVPDLRDRAVANSSKPDITQQQLICEDLPVLFELLTQRHSGQRFFLMGHGWGGVLLAAALIRQPAWIDQVAGLVQLAVRRTCSQRNWQQLIVIDGLWRRVAPALARYKGYVPLRGLGLGVTDISLELHAESLMWQNNGIWRDPQDGFDYAAALGGINWPSSLYITGNKDRAWAHCADVKAFARELGNHDAQLVLLEKGSGSARDYGHHDLLTHPQAANDHFPLVLSWLARQRKSVN